MTQTLPAFDITAASSHRERLLLSMCAAMSQRLGPSNWWPGETPFEVAVGAVLTQNTNWDNVEKALNNLKDEGLLHPQGMLDLSPDQLAELIRPAGYFRVKAKRLRNLLLFLESEYGFDFEAPAVEGLAASRAKLLSVNGVGPETADSILLYACGLPTFVVDAYTARMFNRHGLIEEDARYDDLQALFMGSLASDVALFNEYHALIVRTAKEWCRKKKPLCEDCPLSPFLESMPS